MNLITKCWNCSPYGFKEKNIYVLYVCQCKKDDFATTLIMKIAQHNTTRHTAVSTCWGPILTISNIKCYSTQNAQDDILASRLDRRLRSIKASTTRLKNSFFPVAVRIMTSRPWNCDHRTLHFVRLFMNSAYELNWDTWLLIGLLTLRTVF